MSIKAGAGRASAVISHKHRFIFIKTCKAEGTSIEVLLSQRSDPEDVFTPIIPPVEPHVARNHDGFYNHIPASQVKEKVPREVWEGYFKFCVERNPWDKTPSHYSMMNYRSGGALTFDDYLATGDLPVSYPLYTDATGSRIIVDRVLRYERLMQDLGAVFGLLTRSADAGGLRAGLSSHKPQCRKFRARELRRWSARRNGRPSGHLPTGIISRRSRSRWTKSCDSFRGRTCRGK